MDEPRVSPHFIPNRGKDITILYGEPLNDSITTLVDEYRERFPQGWRPQTYDRNVGEDLEVEPEGLADLRSRIAAQLRVGLMDLGKETAQVERLPPSKIVGW